MIIGVWDIILRIGGLWGEKTRYVSLCGHAAAALESMAVALKKWMVHKTNGFSRQKSY